MRKCGVVLNKKEVFLACGGNDADSKKAQEAFENAKNTPKRVEASYSLDGRCGGSHTGCDAQGSFEVDFLVNKNLKVGGFVGHRNDDVNMAGVRVGFQF